MGYSIQQIPLPYLQAKELHSLAPDTSEKSSPSISLIPQKRRNASFSVLVFHLSPQIGFHN